MTYEIKQFQKPKPENFGLSLDVINFFENSPAEEWEWLPPILGWVSFFAFILFFPPKFLFKDELYWPILLLYFLPGLAAGIAINKLKKFLHEYRIRNHKDHSRYLKYLEACDKYSQYKYRLFQIERKKKRVREQKLRQEIAWWKGLNGGQFERELARLLSSKGYKVKLTGGPGDGGIDILLEKEEKKIIVQCKAHKNYISPGAIRDLYGTLIHYRANEAWLVATSGFYRGAKEFANNKPIRLFTIRDILEIE